ncbi:hypothetical protein NADFUDRAFT_39715 [Nadsonia fulvescens var. elongata DSM 6958]|uniref:MARVEL domain-containing protein n=1 Tax=Nadsonia fulvescens var. elongata DSM 6958 TaxID=857566 RepID=A0A1E3PSD6_9ASCO|nr:hypothetical protein NADFUDRAFT_39715 [Nadsonia fulvescens var. elongata DSM 6958]
MQTTQPLLYQQNINLSQYSDHEGDSDYMEPANDNLSIIDNYLDPYEDNYFETNQLNSENYEVNQSLIDGYLANEAKLYSQNLSKKTKSNNQYQSHKGNKHYRQNKYFETYDSKNVPDTLSGDTSALYQKIQSDATKNWAEPSKMLQRDTEHRNGINNIHRLKSNFTKPHRIQPKRYLSEAINTGKTTSRHPAEINPMHRSYQDYNHHSKTNRRVSEPNRVAYYMPQQIHSSIYNSKPSRDTTISSHLDNIYSTPSMVQENGKQQSWYFDKSEDAANKMPIETTFDPGNMSDAGYFNTDHYKSPDLHINPAHFAAVYGGQNTRISPFEIPGLPEQRFEHSEYLEGGHGKNTVYDNYKNDLTSQDISTLIPEAYIQHKTSVPLLKPPFRQPTPQPSLRSPLSFSNKKKAESPVESDNSFEINSPSNNRPHYYRENQLIGKETAKPSSLDEDYTRKFKVRRLGTHIKNGYQAVTKIRPHTHINIITPSNEIVIHDVGYLIGIVFSLIIIGISGYNIKHDPIISRGFWIYLLFNQIFSVSLLSLYLFQIMHYPSIFYTVYALLCLILTITGFGLTLANCFSPQCVAISVSPVMRPICQKHKVIVVFMSTSLIFWTIVASCVIYAYRRGLEVQLEDEGGTEIEHV